MAVFFAFFLGKWLADQRVKNVTVPVEEFRLQTMEWTTSRPKWGQFGGEKRGLDKNFTRISMTTMTTERFTKMGTTEGSLSSKEIQLNAKRTTLSRNFTLADVVPPALQHLDVVEAVHGWGDRQRSEDIDTMLTSLPKHIIPIHYDITLDVTSIPSSRFASMSKTTQSILLRGNVSIEISVIANSTNSEILLHTGRKMYISRIRFIDKQGHTIPIESKNEDNEFKRMKYQLAKKLSIARYTIHIEYSTPLCTEDGLVCSLVNYQNGTSLLESVTTKFEPTYARNVFPCWDEPHVKATFNITLIHPTWLIALSNMPMMERIEATRGLNGRDAFKASISRFEKTPLMSAYLVGFAVGDWISLESRSGSGVQLRVWVGRSEAADGTVAAQLAPVLLERIENDLQITFPIPKLDIVSARSFPVGGIENWGLVIIDSGALLTPSDIHGSINMTVDRLFHEYRIEKIVAHEIAHQWFGDLVSVKSWDELWLSEGITCHVVEELLAKTHPLLSQFDSNSRLADMTRLQSLGSAPSLVRQLSTEHDVERSFHSSHLYTKGSVLLRMITHLVSDFDFRNALKKYIDRFGHSSADRADLFSVLPSGATHGAEPLELRDVLEPWLVNPGIPEVIVSRSYDSSMIYLWQRKASVHRYAVFLNDASGYDEAFEAQRRESRDVGRQGDEAHHQPKPWNEMMGKKRTRKPRPHSRRKNKGKDGKNKDGTMNGQRPPREIGDDIWIIPFSYMFGTMKSIEGQVVRELWLMNRTIGWSDVELSPNEVLIVNPDWKFPYRVNYDRQNWKMIARLLHRSSDTLPVATRMQLLTDAEVYLAHSEVPHLYIYILGYLSEEKDLGVALLGLDAVYRLADSFKGSSISPSLLSYFAPFVSQLDRLLKESQSEPELAALWLVEPTRLSKLYQLRCATNTSSCDHEKQTAQWVASGGAAAEDVHRQATALCHSLAGKPTQEELSLVWSQLSSEGWSVGVQLAACANDSKLTAEAAAKVVATRNAAVYASALQSDFSLNYNRLFRTMFWQKMSELSTLERVVLFSANLTEPRPASTVLLHSVRTHEELRQVRSLIPEWGHAMNIHVEWVERLLLWHSSVSRSLSDFFRSDRPTF
ncbi:unnamed protein product, partial [Mesorhabditis belari]|uniref:Aminopeptidase n=1 Tax=Mesorhabditis belari TaxID=2138241 RepID=A0AAF3FEM9_9BILA